MRRILITGIVIFIAFTANAQLSNTKWKGTLNIEGGMDVLFNFNHDTLDVSSVESGESLEEMKYSATDSVLTLVKLFGQSQCDSAPGKYKYVMDSSGMTLSLISDECPDRAAAIGTLQLKKED